MDLAKTQFELNDAGFVCAAYRRKRSTILFDGQNRPIRFINHAEWKKLNADWPEEVKADGLTIRTVWTLVQVAL